MSTFEFKCWVWKYESRWIIFVCESRPTQSLMSVGMCWASSSIKEWYGTKSFIYNQQHLCHGNLVIGKISFSVLPNLPGWVLSTPPACPPWTSSASTCPCTCSVGPWCVVMCRRKGSSRPLAPTTSTWPCCWSSYSFPLCPPSTPSSPSPLHLTVDHSGNWFDGFNESTSLIFSGRSF